MGFRVGEVAVLVGLLEVDKRVSGILQPFSCQAPTQSVERFEHAGEARMPPEQNQPPALVVQNALVIHQLTAHFHHSFQHRHVVGLALGGVRKEKIGLSLCEELLWHLLHPHHHLARRKVLLNSGTRLAVGFLRKHPEGRWLHVHIHSGLHQPGNVGRS